MSNNSSRASLFNQRSPRLSLGDHDSTVAKLQGFFCTLSQTAQSIGNKLRVPSPRASFGKTEAMSERVCLKELLQQEESSDATSWSTSTSCSAVESIADQTHCGIALDCSTIEEWDPMQPIVKNKPWAQTASSPPQEVPVLKINGTQNIVSPSSPESPNLTHQASMLFDDSTFDYIEDINANVTDSILLSPNSDLILYKDTPLAKAVCPKTLFSTPSPSSREDDSWIEPWYLLADTYRTDVSQALVRPLSYYLSTMPLDITSSSFESGNGSVIDLSWDEYDMVVLNSPPCERTSQINRRSLAHIKSEDETLSQKKKRISVAACLRSPVLSPLLQSPNSPFNNSGSLRKLSQRSRHNLGTPLTLGYGRNQRRNYDDKTDEELVKILCDRDREIEKLKTYRDNLLLCVVDGMSRGQQCS